ncbi:MAG: hypothetical protein QM767_04675 [Anaeromyxobacter sp.]
MRLSPGFSVAGVASPEAARPAPEVAREEMVRSAFPALERLTVRERRAPTATSPKATAPGLADSRPTSGPTEARQASSRPTEEAAVTQVSRLVTAPWPLRNA